MLSINRVFNMILTTIFTAFVTLLGPYTLHRRRLILSAPPDFVQFEKRMSATAFTYILDRHFSKMKYWSPALRKTLLLIIYMDLYNYDKQYTGAPGTLLESLSSESYSYRLTAQTCRLIGSYMNHPLSILHAIVSLNLSNFGLSYVPSEELTLFPRLQLLNISNTGLKSGYERLRVLKELRGLYLADNKVTTFPYFGEFPHISNLVMAGNKFDTIDFRAYTRDLGRTYTKMPEMKLLDLSRCGLKSMINLEAVMPNLTDMNLGSNQLKDEPMCVPRYPTGQLTVNYKGNPFCCPEEKEED